MIYLDNAATTQMSEVALDALMYASRECYGNPSSIYTFGKKARKLLEESRTIIAECIGANPEEIYFTSCGTESDNWAISQAVYQKCGQVITTKIEHHAVLNPVEELEKNGYITEYLPVDNGCVVDVNALKKMLNGKKSLVSVMFQNNETGVVQPIHEIAELVHKDNSESIFHTDAVQAVGHVKINVKELGVDMLSASAHKFNGPKGIGFLYVRSGCHVSPMILGGGQEKAMRSGTESIAAIYSMAKALEENIKELDSNIEKMKGLEAAFFDGLRKNQIEYKVNANNSLRTPGVFNVSLKNIDGEGLLNMLDMHDVCISIGSACNSKDKEPSYVLTAMGVSDELIDEAVRVSFGKFNSILDVETLLEYIKKYQRAVINVM